MEESITLIVAAKTSLSNYRVSPTSQEIHTTLNMALVFFKDASNSMLVAAMDAICSFFLDAGNNIPSFVCLQRFALLWVLIIF